jgi:tripartite-type tricarboxylate transporter receptor subunit TctC
MSFLLRACVACAAFLFLGTTPANAQPGGSPGYPNKPIRFVVPYPPGGLSDTVARLLGQQLSGSFGQQVVIDNRPGSAGIAATELVARSAPDGYALLFVDPQQMGINPALYSKLPYDPQKDFTPVTLAAYSPMFLVVHAGVAANTFAELVALARAKPGELNYGSGGPGSIHHLTTESLKAALGLDIVHVPYKGAAQAVPALVGGQVSLVFASLPALLPHVKAGRARILAVSTGTRSRLAPEVPTIAELGVPGFDFVGQIGIVAPAGTPRDIVAKLNAEIVKVLRQPGMMERLAGLGIEPVGSKPEEFAEKIRSDIDRFAKAVAISGMKAD